jgi:hypothetical protein
LIDLIGPADPRRPARSRRVIGREIPGKPSVNEFGRAEKRMHEMINVIEGNAPVG